MIYNDLQDAYVYIYLDPRKPGQYNYCTVGRELLYEPFYVGQGIRDRYLSHLGEAYRRINEKWRSNTYKSHLIRKIKRVTGRDPIVEKLAISLTIVQAKELERRIIKEIGRRMDKTGPLVNLTEGGSGGDHLNRISKEKRKEIHARSVATTKATGALKGKNHPLFGQCRTKDVKDKISKNHVRRDGSHNLQAKNWELISLTGERFLIKGTLKEFCRIHRLSYSMIKSCRNKGPIRICSFALKVTELMQNTIGWQSKEL